VPWPGSPAQADASPLDHLEKGLIMSIYAQCACIACAVMALAIPLLGIRLIARFC
jgi:hypothetical protein